ncbi:D-glycero-beta-D-manno-heptose-1,7-bisphosphate 7-phosphatase [Alkalilimnicola ehrlichii]|uniref:D,D-heptose 1,7-bisphosphate phosphatase n=1 Tax=Alkalilimnicola ehrlichii TaxID=351052 RepID=A0A3E0X188_9GAMM|nr:D-glycero-beta-D-manno-heptose 1,7-bisphosphate 7-phosphatase [Alkalilimnicola ehrlichii]RFA30659.1 D-glycero-beta-D-manno-heptose-1,7-bisphosphate 7-phosphatase [Alkalilimnicola ehrlichii]RFA38237.1 D-glycero-beta-D-manno-heptose-1,7-bisphosphate 7-phosphatase [Alkalilimnicola ehrlichii]
MYQDSPAKPGERLVVLDRDGVINADSDAYIKSPAEWVALPGSLEAIARLNRAGFRIVVFTNQSGIARGLFDEAMLSAMHEKLARELAAQGGKLSGIYVCPHGPKDNCHCRKPRTGLLEQISEDFACTLEGVPIIGDSRRDLEAAEAVGGRPILVRTGKGLRTLKDGGAPPKEVYADLAEAAGRLVFEMESQS